MISMLHFSKQSANIYSSRKVEITLLKDSLKHDDKLAKMLRYHALKKLE